MLHSRTKNSNVSCDAADETDFFALKVRVPRLVDVGATLVLGAGSALFFQSYIDGSHGMMAERVIREELNLLKGQNAVLDHRISAQENLNHRLSDTFLDLDLLEERARVLLGYVHPRDVLIEQ